MRGRLSAWPPPYLFFRLTPAYAGKIGGQWELAPMVKAHPRVCGEDMGRVGARLPYLGSPPRMRGRYSIETQLTVYAGLTPAHAGKIVVIKPISALSKRKLCNLEHLFFISAGCRFRFRFRCRGQIPRFFRRLPIRRGLRCLPRGCFCSPWHRMYRLS